MRRQRRALLVTSEGERPVSADFADATDAGASLQFNFCEICGICGKNWQGARSLTLKYRKSLGNAMEQTDYMALLKQARANLPQNVGNKERWTLPKADLIIEGRMTILRNFRALLEATRREEAAVAKFLLAQIGTAGNVDGDRLVFTGKVTDAKLQGVLDDYVETYVRCSECGAPDTHVEKEGRVQILRCEACGARTPIKARKARRPEAAVKEGGVYEIRLSQPGQRGEGKGTYEGYYFIVPGGQVGQTVWAKVNRLSGKMAFSELTTKPKD